MLKKIKAIVKKNERLHKETMMNVKESIWANVYHDSIRGKEWLQEIPLNVGRWAGNYAFFYVLNRILSDCKPQKILELGLGESSKFISTFIKNYITTSQHTIVEHDDKWIDFFKTNFTLSDNSKIVVCPLEKRLIYNKEVNAYTDFEKKITTDYDLYVIDGPFGSPSFSRYEIVNIAQNFKKNDEFIIVFDDFQRHGEKETVNALFQILDAKPIKYYVGKYAGNKEIIVIATEKYRFARSL